jgi:hypothetical protein
MNQNYDFLSESSNFLVSIVLNEIKNNLINFQLFFGTDNFYDWYQKLYINCTNLVDKIIKDDYSINFKYEQENFTISNISNENNTSSYFAKLIQYVYTNNLYFEVHIREKIYLIVSSSKKLIIMDSTLKNINLISASDLWNKLLEESKDLKISLPFIQSKKNRITMDEFRKKLYNLSWCEIMGIEAVKLFDLCDDFVMFKRTSSPAKFIEFYEDIKSFRLCLVRWIIKAKVDKYGVDVTNINNISDTLLHKNCILLEIICPNMSLKDFLDPKIKSDAIESIIYTVKIR